MVEFRHVLCPVDFSDASMRALTYAAALASWYESRLEVLHVLPQATSAAPDDLAGRSDAPPMREKAVAELRDAIERVGADALSPALVADDGPVHTTIARRVGAWPADLLVMGTHGRSGFNRLLLGSVTEKVLRTVSCPVLTVPATAPPMTAALVAFKQIVCAVDYGPSSLRAPGYALELARQANGCVTVLYALEHMDPDEPCEHVDADIRRRREHLLAHCARPASRAARGRIESVVCDHRAGSRGSRL